MSTFPQALGIPAADEQRSADDAARPRGRMDSARGQQKGQQTRAAILDAALGLASQMGIEGLSIGALAEVTGMSKSGVFAHFGSREELQISVIREYHARFEEEVFRPAIKQSRGMPRLRALFEGWIGRVAAEIDSGCIYISGAVEFDDRPGPVRDALAAMVMTWHGAMTRAIQLAIESGDLLPDTDPAELLFELHGLILSLHYDARFLRSSSAIHRAHAAFDRLVAYYASSAVRHATQEYVSRPAASAREAQPRPSHQSTTPTPQE